MNPELQPASGSIIPISRANADGMRSLDSTSVVRSRRALSPHTVGIGSVASLSADDFFVVDKARKLADACKSSAEKLKSELKIDIAACKRPVQEAAKGLSDHELWRRAQTHSVLAAEKTLSREDQYRLHRLLMTYRTPGSFPPRKPIGNDPAFIKYLKALKMGSSSAADDRRPTTLDEPQSAFPYASDGSLMPALPVHHTSAPERFFRPSAFASSPSQAARPSSSSKAPPSSRAAPSSHKVATDSGRPASRHRMRSSTGQFSPLREGSLAEQSDSWSEVTATDATPATGKQSPNTVARRVGYRSQGTIDSTASSLFDFGTASPSGKLQLDWQAVHEAGAAARPPASPVRGFVGRGRTSMMSPITGSVQTAHHHAGSPSWALSSSKKLLTDGGRTLLQNKIEDELLNQAEQYGFLQQRKEAYAATRQARSMRQLRVNDPMMLNNCVPVGLPRIHERLKNQAQTS